MGLSGPSVCLFILSRQSGIFPDTTIYSEWKYLSVNPQPTGFDFHFTFKRIRPAFDEMCIFEIYQLLSAIDRFFSINYIGLK